VDAFLTWLFQNLGWEALKKALPASKRGELKIFKQALEDTQRRNRELEQDEALMLKLVEQRNVALARLVEAQRRIRELESEVARLRREPTKPNTKTGARKA
jgi:hypothetical protein